MPDDAGYTDELGASAEKLLIAKTGLEGSSLEIYGNRSVQGWTFWAKKSTIDLDENDDDYWRHWTAEPTADLSRLLPREWPLFYSLAIHSAFGAWFRQAYETSRASLTPDLRRSDDDHQHLRWLEVLGDEAGPRAAEL
jgi:hypothetical protein